MLPDATAVRNILTSGGVDAVEVETSGLGVICRVRPEAIVDALGALRESDLDFRMLADLFGTDIGDDGVAITYHLRSLSHDEDLYVRIIVPHGGACRSVWNIFPSALLPERETAELLGLSLAGHPNPKRLLTTDGVEPLLLKSVVIRTLEEVRER